jgi:hypothetical protein
MIVQLVKRILIGSLPFERVKKINIYGDVLIRTALHLSVPTISGIYYSEVLLFSTSVLRYMDNYIISFMPRHAKSIHLMQNMYVYCCKLI